MRQKSQLSLCVCSLVQDGARLLPSRSSAQLHADHHKAAALVSWEKKCKKGLLVAGWLSEDRVRSMLARQRKGRSEISARKNDGPLVESSVSVWVVGWASKHSWVHHQPSHVNSRTDGPRQ